MAPSFETLEITVHDPKVMVVTMNRPQALNAINARMHAELVQIWRDAQQDDAVSVVVLTGAAECGYPWQFSAISAALMTVFFALFANFYQQAYSKGEKGKKVN